MFFLSRLFGWLLLWLLMVCFRLFPSAFDWLENELQSLKNHNLYDHE